MWLKLFFLLLYFLVLFVLARFFEAVVWYETGIFATQLVDPVTLSFKKLKTILEGRGLGYSGLAEKRDVRELVENSGNSGFTPKNIWSYTLCWSDTEFLSKLQWVNDVMRNQTHGDRILRGNFWIGSEFHKWWCTKNHGYWVVLWCVLKMFLQQKALNDSRATEVCSK